MDDHLTKPYSRATLAGVIERWVPTARLLGRGDADKECTEPAGERIRSEGSTAPDDVLAPDALEQLASIPGAETSGLVDRVITVYLETSLPLGGVIREACERGTPEEVARAAHRLKSSSREIGANRVAKLSDELEQIARAGGLGGVDELAAQLERELESVRQRLESRRE